MKEVSEDINTITLFLGVFLCAFMSLAYGTVMYVWMMEHCDGELFPSTLQFLFLNVFSFRSNQDCAWSLSSLQLWILGLDDRLDRLPRP